MPHRDDEPDQAQKGHRPGSERRHRAGQHLPHELAARQGRVPLPFELEVRFEMEIYAEGGGEQKHGGDGTQRGDRPPAGPQVNGAGATEPERQHRERQPLLPALVVLEEDQLGSRAEQAENEDEGQEPPYPVAVDRYSSVTRRAASIARARISS